MTYNQYRRRWLRLHKAYEKRAFVIFRNSLRESANRIPWEQMDEYNYQTLIEYNINDDKIQKAYFDTYFYVGLLHGNRVGKELNKNIKAFIPEFFTETFRYFLKLFITDNLGQSITTVRQSFIVYLLEEITKGMDNGLNIRQIARNMQRLVNSRNFYRWQALRIARTETTTAANYAASIAGKETGLVLEKVWLSAQDDRTRRNPRDEYDHLNLNEVRVDEDEAWDDNGTSLMYPGDPNADAGSRINCRCSMVQLAKLDSEGNIMFK